MKNFILKLVSKEVLNSENANLLLQNSKDDIDMLWKGLEKGMISEEPLSKFYEEEGYPVIRSEGSRIMDDDSFLRFFTPDILLHYLIFPISFKRENRDIIIGFVNSSKIKEMNNALKQMFPGFSATFFHIPYSLYKKMLYKAFLLDISKYYEALQKNYYSEKVLTDLDSEDEVIFNKLSDRSERVMLFRKDGNAVTFRDDKMENKFPLRSLPVVSNAFENFYTEMSLEKSLNYLSNTEKIVFFTNMGLKKSDRVVLVKISDSSIFVLINTSLDKEKVSKIVSNKKGVQA